MWHEGVDRQQFVLTLVVIACQLPVGAGIVQPAVPRQRITKELEAGADICNCSWHVSCFVGSWVAA